MAQKPAKTEDGYETMTPSKKKARQTADRRLAIVRGQINALERMIQDEEDCVEIVRLVSAVQSALAGISKMLLKQHLEGCVADAIRGDHDHKAGALIDDVVDTLYKYSG